MSARAGAAKKIGRPSVYDEQLTPKLAYWMAHAGLTDAQMAEELGVTPQTIGNWKNEHAEFLEALKRGKEVPDDQVVAALLRKALGYEYEEVNEKFGVTTKVQHPDTTACIFWLKNRRPADWRDVKEVNQGISKELVAKLQETLAEAIRANLSPEDGDRVMRWVREKLCVETESAA